MEEGKPGGRMVIDFLSPDVFAAIAVRRSLFAEMLSAIYSFFFLPSFLTIRET